LLHQVENYIKQYTDVTLSCKILRSAPIYTTKFCGNCSECLRFYSVTNLLYSPGLYFTKFRKIQTINSSFHICCSSNSVNENFSHVKKCFIYFLCTSSIFQRRSRPLLVLLTSLPVSAVCRKINTWTHEYRRFVPTLLRIQ
jgi:hypothetical protein